MNKKGIYIICSIYAVLGASAFTYYILNPVKIGGHPGRGGELAVKQMEFTTLNDSDIIILHVTNSGVPAITVATIKINDDLITGEYIHSLTIEPGDSGTITVEHDWTPGNSYTVSLFTSSGTLVGGYRDTAA